MRRYIDIINEFAEPDSGDGGGEGSPHTVMVTNIVWDCDGEDCDLPAEVTMQVYGDASDLSEEISEKLSADYGFCVETFRYRVI